MTMRDDVRTALERQQSALGDVADARHRLMHDAMVNRDAPASRSLQWAAGVAAILIAAIVITTFALVRAGSHTSTAPAATPSPTSSPSPLANQINVPDSTPIILYHDPVNFDQVDGATWDGKTSGRLGAGSNIGGAGNPQGTFYDTDQDIRDRTGAVIQAYAPIDYGIAWADDGVHFCDLTRTAARDVTAPAMLQIGAPGRPRRDVGRVGTMPNAGLNAGGPAVIACSPAADRAVVYQSGGQGLGVAQFWVVQLSTGRIIWRGGNGGYIAASHDGQFVALTGTNGTATIYGPSGARAGSVADTVFAFSWDGSLVVVGQTPRIVEWRTGQTIWTCPGNAAYYYGESFPEPGGSLLAIGAANPAYPANGFQPVDLFVVGADGVVVFEKKGVVLIQYA